MFEVLKRFAHRQKHKQEKQRALQQNAMRILKRDHMMAQLQAEQGEPGADAAPADRPAEMPIPAAGAQKVTAKVQEASSMALMDEGAFAAGALPEINPPPGFEEELRRLSKLMDFDD